MEKFYFWSGKFKSLSTKSERNEEGEKGFMNLNDNIEVFLLWKQFVTGNLEWVSGFSGKMWVCREILCFRSKPDFSCKLELLKAN